MAVHKVPQDVEAEDKFLGPLSFKQFLFGGGAAVFGYLTFLTLTKGIWPVAFIFGIPAAAFAILAFPWSKEQPTELWLAARIRFFIKPRRRIWDQTGMKDLVTVTAPIRPLHAFTDGLSQTEVHSRLSALATMVDSRGWAVKNYAQQDDDSDRLVEGNVQAEPAVTINEKTDDVMDEKSGVLAQQFENKIKESEQKHKSETQRLIEEARQASKAGGHNDSAVNHSGKNHKHAKYNEDFWFMHQQQQPPTDPSLATFSSSTVVHPGQAKDDSAQQASSSDEPALDENALLEKAHEKQRRDAMQTHSTHLKTIDPLGSKKHSSKKTNKSDQKEPMTTDVDPDILKYANNNDLSVETIQRQGHKKDNLPPNEVVVSLH